MVSSARYDMEQDPGRVILASLADKAQHCLEMLRAFPALLLERPSSTFADAVAICDVTEHMAMQRTMFAYGASVLALRLMRADGEVNARERKAFSALFALDGMSVTKLQALLAAAGHDKAPVRQYSRQMREVCAGDKAMLRTLLLRLARLALADAPMSEREYDIVLEYGRAMGFSRAEVAHLADEAEGAAAGSPAELLRVRGDEADDVLRQAYHERMRYCHPDRWGQKEQYQELYRLATVKAAAVNEAYRALTEKRSAARRM